MKKAVKFAVLLFFIIFIAIVLFILTYEPEKYTDYGVFKDLRNYVPSVLEQYGAEKRQITEEFRDFTIELSFPFSLLFGEDRVGVPLIAYKSDRIATATVSQFELPPESEYYRDFTINVRPRYEYHAPVLHMDFMKPSPGTPGLCTIDFFIADKETINLSAFLGKQIEKVTEAYESVQPYQRTLEEGRGKITRYLDPYKSTFRMELVEPEGDNDTARQNYYCAVKKAFKTVFQAYLKSLQGAGPDSSFAPVHEQKITELVRLIYEKDFAVSMGKKIFKDSFKRYWLDGFWNVNADLSA